MTRAQPDQPQSRPYQSTPGDDQPYGYPSGPGAAGPGGYGPAGAAPIQYPGDPGTAPLSRTGAAPPPAGTPDGATPDGATPVGATPVGATPVDAGAAGSTPPAVAARKHSRTGAAWVAVVVAAIVLIFFLIFILQNSDQVQVQYLGWEGTLSLGVAMMFAALAGALTVGLLGTVRIMQLRARAKRAGG